MAQTTEYPPASMPRQALRADTGQGTRFSSDALVLGILIKGHWVPGHCGDLGKPEGLKPKVKSQERKRARGPGRRHWAKQRLRN